MIGRSLDSFLLSGCDDFATVQGASLQSVVGLAGEPVSL
jgi:hypothetical protein